MHEGLLALLPLTTFCEAQEGQSRPRTKKTVLHSAPPWYAARACRLDSFGSLCSRSFSHCRSGSSASFPCSARRSSSSASAPLQFTLTSPSTSQPQLYSDTLTNRSEMYSCCGRTKTRECPWHVQVHQCHVTHEHLTRQGCALASAAEGPEAVQVPLWAAAQRTRGGFQADRTKA